MKNLVRRVERLEQSPAGGPIILLVASEADAWLETHQPPAGAKVVIVKTGIESAPRS